MVARGTRLNPTRPREIASERSAQGSTPDRGGGQTQQHPPIRRFKGEHLPCVSEDPFDCLERGRRAGGQDQFARLIVADSGQTRQIKRARQLKGSAEAAFRAAGDEFERLLRGNSVADRLAQFSNFGGRDAAHLLATRSKTRQLWEWQTARMDVETTQLGAAVKLRKHFAGVQRTVRIEGTLQALLMR